MRGRWAFVVAVASATLPAFLPALAGEFVDFDDVYKQYCACGARLAPFVRDTAQIVHEALGRGATARLVGPRLAPKGAFLGSDSGETSPTGGLDRAVGATG